MTTAHGHVRNFIPSSNGLYYADFFKDFNYIVEADRSLCLTDSSYQLEYTVLGIENVEANKSKFSKQDIICAETTCKLQHSAGHLSYWQLLKIAQKHQLKNSLITPHNVRLVMQTILGLGIPGLKGKIVRKQKEGVQPDIVTLPQHIDY